MAVDLLEDLRRITAELDRLEEQRHETEVRYRALVEVAPLAIGVVGTDGTILTVNDQAVKQNRYTGSFEMIGMYAGDLVHADDLPAFREALLSLSVGESLRGFECRMIRKDGEVYFVVISAAALGTNNEVTGYEVIVEDITERKSIEDAVRRSEEIHRLLVENASDIIYVINDQCVFTFVSPRWTALLGHAMDEVLGCSFEQFVYPDDIDGCRAFIQTLRQGDMSPAHEYRIRHSDGRWLWYCTRLMSLRSQDGKGWQHLGIMRDVTARKREEEIIRIERQMFATGPAVIFRWRNEPKWPVEYVSNNVMQQFGYLPEIFLSGLITFEDITHPDDVQLCSTRIQRCVAQGETSYELEYRIKRSDGAWRWVLEHSLIEYSADGYITDIRGYILDTTEHHNAMQKLAESEMRYRAVVEDQTEKICRWLPDGTLTFVNQSYCAYFGYTEQQLLGKNYLEFLPDDAADIMRDTVAQLRAGENIISTEHKVLHNGIMEWQRWTDRALRDENDCIREIQSVGHDITKRKEIELQLRESEQRLRLVFDMVSDTIIIVDDRTCEILDVNANACALFGYEEHEMLLMHHYDIMKCDRAHHLRNGLQDICYRHKDGSEFNAMTTVVRFVQGERNVTTMTMRIQPRFAWNKLRRLTEMQEDNGA